MNQLTGIFYHTDSQWTSSGKSYIMEITQEEWERYGKFQY